MADVRMVPAEVAGAASHVRGRIPDVVKVLTDLSSALESNSSALVGGAAVGLVEALTAWSETAAKLPEVLVDYAEALGAVATSTATTDADGSTTLTLAGLGVGPSLLNMD